MGGAVDPWKDLRQAVTGGDQGAIERTVGPRERWHGDVLVAG